MRGAVPGTAAGAYQVGSDGEVAIEAVMRNRLLTYRVQHEPAQATVAQWMWDTAMTIVNDCIDCRELDHLSIPSLTYVQCNRTC